MTLQIITARNIKLVMLYCMAEESSVFTVFNFNNKTTQRRKKENRKKEKIKKGDHDIQD